MTQNQEIIDPPQDASVEQAEQARQADAALLSEKLRSSLGIFIDVYGVSNIAASADLLYEAVFEPENVLEHRNIPESTKFPNRNAILSGRLQTLAFDPAHLPAKERADFRTEFTESIRDTLTRNIDHEEPLFEGARDAVRVMALHGPVAIWTHGDVSGQPAQGIVYKSGLPITPGQSDYEQPAEPGSFEQLKKIAGGGFGEVRRSVARAALEQTVAPRTLNDTIKILASEDKFAPREIDKLAGYFAGQHTAEVNIIEDKLSNIQQLIPLLAARGIAAKGIWVRQGSRHAVEDKVYDRHAIVEAGSIAEAAELIAAGPKTTGVVCDFDGVLSNHGKRVKLYEQAILRLFTEKKWLTAAVDADA